MKRHILFSLAFLAWASASAQSKLNIYVNDVVSSKPIVGAIVKVSPGNQSGVSAANGLVSFKLNEGDYVVNVHFLGYQDVEANTALSGEKTDVFVSMQAEVTELQSVELLALKAGADDPFAKSELNKEELEQLDNGRDIPFVLDQEPSVVTTSDAGAGVGYTNMRVRGSDITRINVTVNGIPLNDPESHGVWWVNTPDLVSSTSGIQLQRGVGTSTNGAGAFGASLNLEAGVQDNQPSATLHLGGGSFNTTRATVGFNTGSLNQNWWASGRLSNIQSAGYVDRARSDLQSYFVSGGFRNEKTSVRAVVFGGGEETYQAWNGVDSATFADNPTFNSAGAIYDENGNITSYYDNEVDNYKQDHYQLHINQLLSKYWSLNLSGHYTYGRGYYEQYRQDEDMKFYNLDPVIMGSDTISTTDLVRRKWLDNDYYGGIFNVAYSKNKVNLIIGGGYHAYEGRHYGEVIWARFASNSEIRNRYYESYSNKQDFNVYAKINYALNDQIILFADAQVRTVDYKGEGLDDDVGQFSFAQSNTFFNPKVGLTYFIKDDLKFYASYAVANKEPNRTDLLYADPNDLPIPETLQDIEVGIDYVQNKYSVSANIFYMNYANQLVLTGQLDNVGSPIRENVGNSFRSGIELVWGVRLTNWLTWNANATYSQNRNIKYREEQPDGSVRNLGNTNIAYSPNIIAASSFKFFPVQHFTVELYSKYVGAQYLSNSDIESHILPDYFLNDLRLSYDIQAPSVKGLRVYFNVQNLFDVKYASNGYTWGPYAYYYAQAGINVMGGVVLKL